MTPLLLTLFTLTSSLILSASCATYNQGTVNKDRDYLVEWDVDEYKNTTDFCYYFHLQCGSYIEEIGGTKVDMDCVNSQKGPDVYVYCGGNSGNLPLEYDDFSENIFRLVSITLLSGPSTQVTINSGNGPSTTTTSSTTAATDIVTTTKSTPATKLTTTSSALKVPTTTTTTTSSTSTSSTAAPVTTGDGVRVSGWGMMGLFGLVGGIVVLLL